MALLHAAELVPSKIDLLRAWLPTRPWCPPGDPAGFTAVGAYRFDDPAGEVGIETNLVDVGGGRTVQVPWTYRAAPLEAASQALVATMQHSVLGQRWVYDAVADPVYAATLAATILTGGTQADLEIEVDGRMTVREPTTRVAGSGAPGTPVPAVTAITSGTEGVVTTVRAGGLDLVVLRELDAADATGPADPAAGAVLGTLAGTWPGRDEPTLLALARRP